MNKRYTGMLYIRGDVHFQESSHDKNALMTLLLNRIETLPDSVHGIVFDSHLSKVIQTFRKDQLN